MKYSILRCGPLRVWHLNLMMLRGPKSSATWTGLFFCSWCITLVRKCRLPSHSHLPECFSYINWWGVEFPRIEQVMSSFSRWASWCYCFNHGWQPIVGLSILHGWQTFFIYTLTWRDAVCGQPYIFPGRGKSPHHIWMIRNKFACILESPMTCTLRFSTI